MEYTRHWDRPQVIEPAIFNRITADSPGSCPRSSEPAHRSATRRSMKNPRSRRSSSASMASATAAMLRTRTCACPGRPLRPAASAAARA